jgi:hypothetical protein
MLGEMGCPTPWVIRSASLVHRFGLDDIVVFGWMPDHDLGGKTRLSAVKLEVNKQAGTLISTPLWTIERETWKSGPALLPVGSPPKVVVGYGIGACSNDPGCGQGSMASCSPLSGGVLAVNVVGNDSERIAWERNFNGAEGQIRASPCCSPPSITVATSSFATGPAPGPSPNAGAALCMPSSLRSTSRLPRTGS